MALKKISLIKDQDDDEPGHKPPERARKASDDESNWLISYADMMTLLCAFFVMMFALANTEKPQFEKIKGEIAKHFGGDYHSENEHLAKFVTQIIQESGLSNSVQIQSEVGTVNLVFQSSLFFDSMTADMSPAGKEALEQLINTIKERQEAEVKQYKILIEGHTDSIPIVSGKYPSNWELSSDRALRVQREFLDRGFDPQLLKAVGYADTKPVKNPRLENGELDPEALTQNRRVVIRIFEPYVVQIPWSPQQF